MERGKRRELMGVVVSDKMNKTRVVAIQRWKDSPIYKKRVRSVSKVKAHDETNESATGDKVRIVECRPYSKDKKWLIAEILERPPSTAGGDSK
jgi:small subunit ribosomal protein S17